MKLTKYEREILRDYENGELIQVPNMEKEIDRLAKIARNSIKNKSISVRINSLDLLEFKEKAVEIGMPYQTLLTSLIKRFNKGKIKSV